MSIGAGANVDPNRDRRHGGDAGRNREPNGDCRAYGGARASSRSHARTGQHA
jgi:hypothetical protein